MIMEDRRGLSASLVRHGMEFDRESNGSQIPSPSPADSASAIDAPRLSSPLDAFAVRIHRSLNTHEVMTVAVQELRPVLNCDRVCYLERRGNKFRLQAVSGQIAKPVRSRQATLLEQFVAAVMQSCDRFFFPDGTLMLPDDISRKLTDYWEQSNGQLILVEPVFDCLPESDDSASSKHRTLVGAVVIEQFSQSTLVQDTVSRLESAMKHLIPALENARRYSRLTSIPGLYQVAATFDLFRRNLGMSILGYAAAFFFLLATACLVKRPFEIECHGRLMPTQRREVFASVEGEIVDVWVHESEQIEQGQIVCTLRSRELEKAIIEQTGMLKGKLKARDAARAELRGRAAPQGRSQPARDQAQLELVNAEIETIQKQLELLELEEGQLELRAPISGTVMTERPIEKLRGRPVRRGEPLLEIMEEVGGWQLELDVGERRIGHLLTYRQKHPQVNVKFRLLSSVQLSYQCQVTRLADRTVPSTELGSSCQVYCDVSDVDQLARQVGSDVSARIQCGERSLFFIWFHEFWELLQRNWLV